MEEVGHGGAFVGNADNPPNPMWTLLKTLLISQSIKIEAINLSMVEFHCQLHEKSWEE